MLAFLSRSPSADGWRNSRIAISAKPLSRCLPEFRRARHAPGRAWTACEGSVAGPSRPSRAPFRAYSRMPSVGRKGRWMGVERPAGEGRGASPGVRLSLSSWRKKMSSNLGVRSGKGTEQGRKRFRSVRRQLAATGQAEGGDRALRIGSAAPLKPNERRPRPTLRRGKQDSPTPALNGLMTPDGLLSLALRDRRPLEWLPLPACPKACWTAPTRS